MRRAALLIACMAFAHPAISSAQGDPDPRKTGYLYSIKCYVANSVAATDRRFGSTAANITKYRAQAQRSYQYIFQLGRAVGNSDALVREDIDSYEVMLKGAFVRNDQAFQQLRSECVQLGLM